MNPTIVQYDYTDALADPMARIEERQILLDLLDVEPGNVVVDAPAWLGYVSEGIPAELGARITRIEPRRDFAALIADRIYPLGPGAPDIIAGARLSRLPMPTASADRVVSAVGLHHLHPFERAAFLADCVRVLRPGGRLVISEVLADTPPARFLNGAVNRLCWTGHNGTFLQPGEAGALLVTAGCVQVAEARRELHWRFPSMLAMGTFCRSLLRMQKATAFEVAWEIAAGDVFELEISSDRRVGLPWPLMYAVGTKPGGNQGSA